MKQKIISLSLIFVLILSLGACAKPAETTKQQPQETQKQTVTIKVIAESKEFSKEVKAQTDKETLGALVEELKIATFTNGDFGKYITGLYDINADQSKQEWWSVLVNGNFAETGVDGIKINEGDVYTFELKVGY